MLPPAPFSHIQGTTTIASLTWPASCDAVEFDARPQYEGSYSLIFVIDVPKRKLLLGTKNRGFGSGIINGYGGKIEAGESMDDCAARELQEESGLVVSPYDLRRRGRLVFTNAPRIGKDSREVIDIAIYTADTWSGDPQETEEMSPQWYSIDGGLPLDKMWPDFQLYFPALLKLALSDDREQLLVRVDYDLTPEEKPSPVPSLQALGIHGYKRTGQTPIKGQDVEAVVGYWMGLAPP